MVNYRFKPFGRIFLERFRSILSKILEPHFFWGGGFKGFWMHVFFLFWGVQVFGYVSFFCFNILKGADHWK